MKLVIEAFGDAQLSRTLIRFADSADNMRPAFDMVHREFMDLEAKQFAGEGIGPSGSWAPLADSTIYAKERLGIDTRILHGESGDLEASLTSDFDTNAIYRVTPDEAFMGSSVFYGVFHQSREPRTRLPRRPPVDLAEANKVHFIKLLQQWLVNRHV